MKTPRETPWGSQSKFNHSLADFQPERGAMKCARTVCTNEAAEVAHLHTGQRYCLDCAGRINHHNPNLVVSLSELAHMYREKMYRVEELTPLLAVARASDFVDRTAGAEKALEQLDKALEAAKQNPLLKAEIEAPSS